MLRVVETCGGQAGVLSAPAPAFSAVDSISSTTTTITSAGAGLNSGPTLPLAAKLLLSWHQDGKKDSKQLAKDSYCLVLEALEGHMCLATTVHEDDEQGWGYWCCYGASVQYTLATHMLSQVLKSERTVRECLLLRGAGGAAAVAAATGGGSTGSATAAVQPKEGPAPSSVYGLQPELLPPVLMEGCGGCNRPNCRGTVSVLRTDGLHGVMRYWVRVLDLQGPVARQQIIGPRGKYAASMRLAAAAMAAWDVLYGKKLETGATAESPPATAGGGEHEDGAGSGAAAGDTVAAGGGGAAATRERPLTQKQLRKAQQLAKQSRAPAPGKSAQQSAAAAAPSKPAPDMVAGTFRLEDCPVMAMDALICAARALGHVWRPRRLRERAQDESRTGVGLVATAGGSVPVTTAQAAASAVATGFARAGCVGGASGEGDGEGPGGGAAGGAGHVACGLGGGDRRRNGGAAAVVEVFNAAQGACGSSEGTAEAAGAAAAKAAAGHPVRDPGWECGGSGASSPCVAIAEAEGMAGRGVPSQHSGSPEEGPAESRRAPEAAAPRAAAEAAASPQAAAPQQATAQSVAAKECDVPLPREWWQGVINALRMAADHEDAGMKAHERGSLTELVRMATLRYYSDTESEDGSEDYESDYSTVSSGSGGSDLGAGCTHALGGIPTRATTSNTGDPAVAGGEIRDRRHPHPRNAKVDNSTLDDGKKSQQEEEEEEEQENSAEEDEELAAARGRRMAAEMAVALPLGLLPCLEALLRRVFPKTLEEKSSVGLLMMLATWNDIEPLAMHSRDARQALSLVATIGKVVPLLTDCAAGGELHDRRLCAAVGYAVSGHVYRTIVDIASGGELTAKLRTAAAKFAWEEMEGEMAVVAEDAVAGDGGGQQVAALGKTRKADPVLATMEGANATATAVEELRLQMASMAAVRWLPAGQHILSRLALDVVERRDKRRLVMLVGKKSLVQHMLEWVPLLCRAYQLTVDAGSATAAAEWRQLLLGDMDAFGLLASTVEVLRDEVLLPGDMVEAGLAALALALVFPQEMAAALAPRSSPYAVGGSEHRGGGRRSPPLLVTALRGCRSGMGCLSHPRCMATLETLVAGPAAGRDELYNAAVKRVQRRLLDQLTAAAAALLPPHRLAALLPVCANPRCANLAGNTEAALPLPLRCRQCGAVAYCSKECLVAHARAGHGREMCAALRTVGTSASV